MDNETLDVAYVPAEPLRILTFSVQGYKRTKNIHVTMKPVGLTKLGGKNRAGKTSTIEGLAHCLFGPENIDKNANPINESATVIEGTRNTLARMKIVFCDGTVVERRLTEKDSRSGIYEVTLPSGQEGSLEDIKRLLSKFALTPPSMSDMSERERLKFVLNAVGVDITDLQEKLDQVKVERSALYDEKERLQKHSNDLRFWEGIPTTEVQAGQIMNALQEAMDKNSANRAKRQDAEGLKTKAAAMKDRLEQQIRLEADLQAQLDRARKVRGELEIDTAEATDAARNAVSKASQLIDIPTDELKTKLTGIDAINRKVRDNQIKAAKDAEAAEVRAAWTAKDQETIAVLAQMKARVMDADIPMAEIGITDDLVVTFAGQPWANMSGMQRLLLRVAISSLYNGNAKCCMIDGIEQLDEDMQYAFHRWIVSRGLQVIATEVASNYDGEPQDDGITRLIIESGTLSA